MFLKYSCENYQKYNKRTEVVLLEDHIIINKEVIKIESIKEVNIYATYQYFNGGVGAATLTYNEYFYYLEIVTNKSKYILTSLLGIELEKKIKNAYPELTFSKKVKWFPLVK